MQQRQLQPTRSSCCSHVFMQMAHLTTLAVEKRIQRARSPLRRASQESAFATAEGPHAPPLLIHRPTAQPHRTFEECFQGQFLIGHDHILENIYICYVLLRSRSPNQQCPWLIATVGTLSTDSTVPLAGGTMCKI